MYFAHVRVRIGMLLREANCGSNAPSLDTALIFNEWTI